jgi:membrane associated rhomboid family serine protease
MIPLRVDPPSGKLPILTLMIIASNILVFVHQLMLGPAETYFIWKYAVVPRAIVTLTPMHPASTLFPPLTLFTSQFVHDGFLHLGSNMLFLWIFGDNIEAKLGHIKFVLFYVICGIVSAIVQIASMPSGQLPVIGASGAIAGVMGAYFLRFPRTRVWTLVFIFFIIRIVRIPAVVFLGFWFIIQVLAGAPTAGTAQGGVAYFAHIGGFLCGMVLFKIMETK